MNPVVPTLADLPALPPDRRGWPWTVAPTPPFPPTIEGKPWPRISIVTPSFNQAQFLEETIRSVLLQGYPNLEYWVMDGGSSDGSVAIIEQYAQWLAGWISEPDRGQSHAINKGFAQATGEWIGWLNSDDCYAPDALRHLIESAYKNSSNFVSGASIRFFDGVMQVPRRFIPSVRAFQPDVVRYTQDFDQPTLLWQRTLFEQFGPLDETLVYTFDWQFFTRCAPSIRPAISDATIACYRIHTAHKTGSGGDRRWQEINQIYATQLEGDDLRAFERVRPWLGKMRWLRALSRNYGRFGAYYLWRLVLNVIRWMVIDRSPPLNPHSMKLLELPYSVATDTSTEMRGPVCDGTVAGALRAFERN